MIDALIEIFPYALIIGGAIAALMLILLRSLRGDETDLDAE